jgi:hypothetical protein
MHEYERHREEQELFKARSYFPTLFIKLTWCTQVNLHRMARGTVESVESWVDVISVLITNIHRTRCFVCCSTSDKHEAVT